MLLRPTPIQQPKIPLQIWPRPLRVAVLCGCPACWTSTISGSDCGVSERDYRVKIFHPACEGFKMGRLSKIFFHSG